MQEENKTAASSVLLPNSSAMMASHKSTPATLAGRNSTQLQDADSDHDESEASEKLLAVMRESFRKKEIGFKNNIKQLN